MSNKIRVIHKKGKEVQEDCVLWAEEIQASFTPDLVVFIAKSGYLFAKPMCEVFGCPMVDLIIERPGNKTKSRMKPLINHMPQVVIDRILSSRLMYMFNEKKEERKVTETNSFLQAKTKEYNNILIIDDSVDTGWTVANTIPVIKRHFPKANIKIASYSVIHFSKKRVSVDYSRVKDEIVITATSRKSDEYTRFVQDYEEWENSIEL